MKKEEIERLKEDEFVSFIEKALKKAGENKKLVFWGIGALLAVVLLIVLAVYIKNQGMDRENHTLYQAVVIKNSNLLTLERKIEKLEQLRPRRGLSYIVNNYLVGLYLETGQTDQARNLLEEAPQSSHKVSNEHRQLLQAQLNRQEGEPQQALDILNRLLSDSQSRLAKDFLLLEIARIQREMDRIPPARQALTRLMEEFPQSLFRREAQEMLTLLGPPENQPAG